MVTMILSLMNYCSCLRFLFFLGVERNQGFQKPSTQYQTASASVLDDGYIPYLKLTYPAENWRVWRLLSFFGRPIFRDYVKLWGGKSLIKKWVKVVKTNYYYKMVVVETPQTSKALQIDPQIIGAAVFPPKTTSLSNERLGPQTTSRLYRSGKL